MNAAWKAAAIAALMSLFPKPAAATPIPITSVTGLEALGSFTGSIEYDPLAFALEILLTNASPAANGGFITAFAFNNPGHLITNATLVSTDPDFGLIGGAGAADFQNDIISVSPFGNADIGASVTGTWLGNGNPKSGIGVGSSGTFTFSFTGTGLGTLTETDFFNALSTGGGGGNALSTGGGGGAEWLLVRFRGFNDDGSDKVGTAVPPPPPPQVVPEPGSVLLLSGGAVALLVRRKKARA